MDATVIGKKIANLRKAKNMTQKQLADELSLTNKAVSKWETGIGLPDIAILPALASVLGVSTDEIIFDSSTIIDNNEKNRIKYKGVRRYKTMTATLAATTFILSCALVYSFFMRMDRVDTCPSINDDMYVLTLENDSSKKIKELVFGSPQRRYGFIVVSCDEPERTAFFTYETGESP